MNVLPMAQAGAALASPIEAIGNVFDKLFTSDDERAKAQAVVERLRQEPYILQAEINKLEAQHRSIFVAGWRPYLGWGCATAMLWHFMLYDFAVWLARANGWTEPPVLAGTESLISVTVALLGIGGLRTFEKIKGKAR